MITSLDSLVTANIWASAWISNNVVCVTSKASDQPAHTRNLIRAFKMSLDYYMTVMLLTEHHLEFLSLKRGRRGSPEFTHVKMPHCWKFHVLAYYRIWAVNEILVLIAYSQKLPMNAGADFSSLVRGIVCACVDIKISVCLLWHIIAENGFCVKTRYALLITLTVKSNRQRTSL